MWDKQRLVKHLCVGACFLLLLEVPLCLPWSKPRLAHWWLETDGLCLSWYQPDLPVEPQDQLHCWPITNGVVTLTHTRRATQPTHGTVGNKWPFIVLSLRIIEKGKWYVLMLMSWQCVFKVESGMSLGIVFSSMLTSPTVQRTNTQQWKGRP
jgi:hypothetical protein